MAISFLDWKEPIPDACRGGAVTIGNFDGVHRGHGALLRELRKQAESVAGPAVVLTFESHPLQLLRPELFQPLLTTATDRAELLCAAGADHVILLKTTRDLLHLTAPEFFRYVIQEKLAARALVEGPNFGFGRDREGTIEILAALCGQAAVNLTIVPPFLLGERTVSSSRVRTALQQCLVREATEMLGRPYHLHGIVRTGQQRGRTIGFPTANLEQIQTLVPKDGVYAVRVQHNGQSWPGAANIGANPTFGENAHKVEVHLIGFQGDLVGQSLKVEFLDRLRDTRPFGNAAELIEQLRSDVEQARQIYRTREN